MLQKHTLFTSTSSQSFLFLLLNSKVNGGLQAEYISTDEYMNIATLDPNLQGIKWQKLSLNHDENNPYLCSCLLDFYPKKRRQSLCSKCPHDDSFLAAEWVEKLSSKNFPNDRLRAEEDIITLLVGLALHLKHLVHIQILPWASPESDDSKGNLFTRTVRVPLWWV